MDKRLQMAISPSPQPDLPQCVPHGSAARRRYRICRPAAQPDPPRTGATDLPQMGRLVHG